MEQPLPQVSRAYWLCLPAVVGLVLLSISGAEMLGFLFMLGGGLPVGYLTVLRQWWWTSIFAALMGLFCLAGIGLVYLIWRHTGCMYGLFVLGAVEVLGTSAIVAGLWGLVAAALARRRPGTTSPAGWTANLAILLVALLIVVPTMAQLLRAWGPR